MEKHFFCIVIYILILLLSLRCITCLRLYLSINLIIVRHPVGRASSWGIVMPYITPPSLCTTPTPHLLSILLLLLLLYVYADDLSKHFSPARRRQA